MDTGEGYRQRKWFLAVASQRVRGRFDRYWRFGDKTGTNVSSLETYQSKDSEAIIIDGQSEDPARRFPLTA